MICPHCGNNIQRDADMCNRCGKPTQFSLKFNYRPASAPVGNNLNRSNDRLTDDFKDTSTNSAEIARIITKALPSRHTIQVWLYKHIGISLLAIILCLAVCLIVFSRSNHRMEQKIESLRPTPTITPTLSPSPTPDQTPVSAQIRFVKNVPRNVKEDQIKNFSDSEIKTEGSPLNLVAEPSIEGYLFTGWNTKEDGKGVNFPRDSVINFNPDADVMTLYAQWARADVGSTLIVFDANLPESASTIDLLNMPADVRKSPNEPISIIQEPALTGYSFVDWNTEKDGTGLLIKSGSKFDINLDMETLTLYAHWDKNN